MLAMVSSNSCFSGPVKVSANRRPSASNASIARRPENAKKKKKIKTKYNFFYILVFFKSNPLIQLSNSTLFIPEKNIDTLHDTDGGVAYFLWRWRKLGDGRNYFQRKHTSFNTSNALTLN